MMTSIEIYSGIARFPATAWLLLKQKTATYERQLIRVLQVKIKILVKVAN